MPIPSALAALAGRWTGDNALWLNPDAEPRRSAAAAEIAVEAEGQSLSVRYEWEDRGAPQSGILLMVSDAKSDALAASWTDSWYFSHQLMECRGTSSDVSASVPPIVCSGCGCPDCGRVGARRWQSSNRRP